MTARSKTPSGASAKLLGLDLSTLWQGSVGPPNLLTLTHFYRRVDGPQPPEQMRASEYFPWTHQQLMAGKVVAVSSTEDVPAEAARDREMWRHFGVKTSLGIPLRAGGGPTFGVLSFNDMKDERTWPDALVQRLQLVAQVFANALARKQADQALRESEARLTLAATSAGVGFWTVEESTGRVWATETLRELFGFAPDVALTPESFYQIAHPEDRERLREAVAAGHAVGGGIPGRVPHPASRREPALDRLSRTPTPELHVQVRSALMGVSMDITERKRAEEALTGQAMYNRTSDRGQPRPPRDHRPGRQASPT